jgi:mannose-6-phosphate isomerase-like protein (cupin superfamily)
VTTDFVTTSVPACADAIAPDGSEVRLLPRLARGGMAHFTLAAGTTSRAVTHRTVEEIWYCVAGRGEMWRSAEGHEEVVTLAPGVAITIPLGTRFQFRAAPDGPFRAVGVTMPPWPGDDEGVVVEGPWEPTA